MFSFFTPERKPSVATFGTKIENGLHAEQQICLRPSFGQS